MTLETAHNGAKSLEGVLALGLRATPLIDGLVGVSDKGEFWLQCEISDNLISDIWVS